MTPNGLVYRGESRHPPDPIKKAFRDPQETWVRTGHREGVFPSPSSVRSHPWSRARTHCRSACLSLRLSPKGKGQTNRQRGGFCLFPSTGRPRKTRTLLRSGQRRDTDTTISDGPRPLRSGVRETGVLSPKNRGWTSRLSLPSWKPLVFPKGDKTFSGTGISGPNLEGSVGS